MRGDFFGGIEPADGADEHVDPFAFCDADDNAGVGFVDWTVVGLVTLATGLLFLIASLIDSVWTP